MSHLLKLYSAQSKPLPIQNIKYCVTNKVTLEGTVDRIFLETKIFCDSLFY